MISVQIKILIVFSGGSIVEDVPIWYTDDLMSGVRLVRNFTDGDCI